MITELRTFIAVVRHGTFAAAGERVGLTQSAISSQIRRLEEQLGFDLFDRTRRTATLNAAGVSTLARAEEIVALCDKLGELPDAADTDSLIRIGAIASVQSSLLPRALASVQRLYPRLRVHLVPGVSMHLMDQVDTGEIDLAILIRPPFGVLPDITWEGLVSEPYMLVVPRALKGNDWRQLIQSQPFLRYERKSFGGRMVERFLRDQHLAVQDTIELDEIQGLIQLVSNGLGVALVPMVESCLPLPANVRAISLGEHAFDREVGVLQRAAKHRHPMAGPLVQCLRDATGLPVTRSIPGNALEPGKKSKLR